MQGSYARKPGVRERKGKAVTTRQPPRTELNGKGFRSADLRWTGGTEQENGCGTNQKAAAEGNVLDLRMERPDAAPIRAEEEQTTRVAGLLTSWQRKVMRSLHTDRYLPVKLENDRMINYVPACFVPMSMVTSGRVRFSIRDKIWRLAVVSSNWDFIPNWLAGTFTFLLLIQTR